MRIADRYILRALLGPMFFGVAAFVSILAASKPLLELTNLAFQGVPLPTLLWLFVLGLPPMVVLTLPMSMLVATLLGFGRLSGDSELVAMYAGGVSLYRLALPVLALALAVSAVTVTLNERVVPASIDAANRLRDSFEQGVKEQRQFELPQYDGGKLVGRVYAEQFNPKTRVMKVVSAVNWSNGRISRVIDADRARFVSEHKWILYNVIFHELSEDRVLPVTKLDKWTITLTQAPADIEKEGKRTSDMSMAELRERIRVYRERGMPSQEFQVAWWNRWAVPFASVVFAIIGLPLGLRPQRSSGGLGIGLSIVIIFVYWVAWSYTSKLGGYGNLPPFIASWMANFLGLGIGAALIARAPK